MRLSEVNWDELRAHVVTHTGWPWEYVGEHMTLPRLTALNKYWEKNPPGGGLGALLGLGSVVPASAPEPQEEGTLEDLIGCWTAAGGSMG